MFKMFKKILEQQEVDALLRQCQLKPFSRLLRTFLENQLIDLVDPDYLDLHSPNFAVESAGRKLAAEKIKKIITILLDNPAPLESSSDSLKEGEDDDPTKAMKLRPYV